MTEAIEYKRGDRVWVEGVVAYDHKLDARCISVTVNGATCYPTMDQIEVKQLHFNKGDLCVYLNDLCTVVSIDGEEAWIKADGGGSWVVEASGLSRPLAPRNLEPGETLVSADESAKGA